MQTTDRIESAQVDTEEFEFHRCANCWGRFAVVRSSTYNDNRYDDEVGCPYCGVRQILADKD
jgi:DNA-directed RNA polymerase subunit RPC12/RpoP